MSVNPDSISADSLYWLSKKVDENYTFDPFQGIYNSVINSGKIELIANDTLKNKIARIQDLIMDYKEEEDDVKNAAIKNLYPFLLKQPIKDFNFNFNDTTSETIQIKLY